jgi:endoglucanase
MAVRMYFLHKTFPDLVSPEYTLRAVNYILGTHPVSSTSYVAGVGTVSKTKTYSNNRADNAYIPGAVIPGYIVIKPDFPEVAVGTIISDRPPHRSARALISACGSYLG